MEPTINIIKGCDEASLKEYFDAALEYSSLYSTPCMVNFNGKNYFAAYRNNGIIVVDDNYNAHLIQYTNDFVSKVFTDGYIYTYNKNQKNTITRHPINNASNYSTVIFSDDEDKIKIEYSNSNLKIGYAYSEVFSAPRSTEISDFVNMLPDIEPKSILLNDESINRTYEKREDGCFVSSSVKEANKNFVKGYSYEELKKHYFEEGFTTNIDYNFIKKIVETSDDELIFVAKSYKNKYGR